jgi:hypothetical protein
MKAFPFRALVTVALLAGANQLSAQSFNFGFDSLADGADANLGAPAGVTFHVGTFSPVLDSEGDAIPGSDRWSVDAGSGAVVVRNPSFYDRGAAPSSPNALDSVFDTTLLMFGTSQILSAFSVTLDQDTFGENPVNIEFYSVGASANTLLGSIAVNQNTPGFIATLSGSLAGVDMIVLPSGALYDNFSYTAVPEPETYLFVSAGLLCGFGLLRRRFAGK